ncbi:MAG: ATP-binding protein [Firmicutes bacterium]|nr:ATP-binding protein [Bacillota bacterium]
MRAKRADGLRRLWECLLNQREQKQGGRNPSRAPGGRDAAGTGLGLGIGLVVILFGLFAVVDQNLSASLTRLDRLARVASQVSGLQRAVMMEEAGERGYSLTHEGVFRSMLDEGSTEFDTESRELEADTPSAAVGHLVSGLIADGRRWRQREGLSVAALSPRTAVPSSYRRRSTQAVLRAFSLLAVRTTDRLDAAREQTLTYLRSLIQGLFVIVLLAVPLVGIVILIAYWRESRERSRRELGLRKMEWRFAQAQRIAGVGDWEWEIVDGEFRFRHWSEEVYRLLGVDRNERVEESTLARVIHPVDYLRFRESMHRLLSGFVHEVQFRVVRNQEERFLRSHGEVLCDELGHIVGAVGTVQDVTDQIRTQHMVLESEKLAIVGQLAAGVAHEVRNPLTAIKGFLRLLPNASPMVAQRYREIMLAEIRQLERTVGELLILAKPEAVQMLPERVEVHLGEVVGVLETDAVMQGVVIELAIAPGVPAVYCSAVQMKQVFLHVMRNALEAMPDGGHLNVRARRVGNDLQITFADTGVGISPERLGTLGEPFYTTKEKGTGMGLLVTRKILEHHGGRISIESQQGEGTTVTLHLPLCTQDVQLAR